jgi:thiamine biosynthesis protein ThiI
MARGEARDFDGVHGAGAQRAVLCRYGEIFLKGLNRGAFEKRLVDNMRRAAAPVGARVERLHGRVLVWPAAGDDPAATQHAVAAMQKVFGLASLSPVRLVDKELDAVAAAAAVRPQT